MNVRLAMVGMVVAAITIAILGAVMTTAASAAPLRPPSAIVADASLSEAEVLAELVAIYAVGSTPVTAHTTLAAAQEYKQRFWLPQIGQRSRLLFDPFYGCKPVGYLSRCASQGAATPVPPTPTPTPEP